MFGCRLNMNNHKITTDFLLMNRDYRLTYNARISDNIQNLFKKQEGMRTKSLRRLLKQLKEDY